MTSREGRGRGRGRGGRAAGRPRSLRGLRQRARRVADRLEAAMPEARIALAFGDDVQLLVSVVLSAQCTDARVNQATPALFAAFPDAAAYARARPEDLWPYLRSLGLFRNKARAIVAAMQAISSDHGGRVPRTRAALEALPGVGRKTAGVVLVHLGAAQAFPVDTHVGRLARRLGFSAESRPERVEQDLMRLYPEGRWGNVHQLLVWHGRRICRARRPDCDRCMVAGSCPRVGVPAPARTPPAAARGPTRAPAPGGSGRRSPRRAPP